MKLLKILGVASLALLLASTAEARLLMQGENASLVAFDFSASDPAANASLTKVPSKLTLTFTDTLNPDATHVTVSDPYGNIISGSVTAGDKAATVDITPFGDKQANGSYNVQWSAGCHCGDTFASGAPVTLNGNFSFNVQALEPNQAAPAPTPTPAAATSAATIPPVTNQTPANKHLGNP